MSSGLEEESERYCAACGRQLSPADRFCGDCGVSIAEPPQADDGRTLHRPGSALNAEVRLFSTFRWGDLPGIVDAGTSVAVDDRTVCRWSPYGFEAVVSVTPGSHRIAITEPTTILGRLLGWAWPRPAVTVYLDAGGRYQARLEPKMGGPAWIYTWEVHRMAET